MYAGLCVFLVSLDGVWFLFDDPLTHLFSLFYVIREIIRFLDRG